MTQLLMLDIDGVLATSTSYERSDPTADFDPASVIRRDLASNVQFLCTAANASIVISSTWRLLYPLDQLVQWLNQAGLIAPVLGVTPDLFGAAARGAEIAHWCHEHNVHPRDLVVLEDEEDVRPYRGRWVQTYFNGPNQGFTADHLRRALRLWELGPPGRVRKKAV